MFRVCWRPRGNERRVALRPAWARLGGRRWPRCGPAACPAEPLPAALPLPSDPRRSRRPARAAGLCSKGG